jgi:hypothetical protein
MKPLEDNPDTYPTADATAEASRAQVRHLVATLLGPSMEQIRALSDEGLQARSPAAVNLMLRVREIAGGQNVRLKALAPAFILPTLNYALAETHTEMQECWAALIVSAARATPDEALLARFVDTLRRLTPDEVKFLDSCFDVVIKRAARLAGNKQHSDESLLEHAGLGDQGSLFVHATGEHAQFGTGVDTYELADGVITHAESLGLIHVPGQRKPPPAWNDFSMTLFGIQFMRACRPPKREARAQGWTGG